MADILDLQEDGVPTPEEEKRSMGSFFYCTSNRSWVLCPWRV